MITLCEDCGRPTGETVCAECSPPPPGPSLLTLYQHRLEMTAATSRPKT